MSRLLPTLVPLLIGAVLVWWLVRAPGHLHRRFPWLTTGAAALLLCCVAFGVAGLFVSADLPGASGLTQDPEAAEGADRRAIAGQLASYGFVPLPAPFNLSGSPRATLAAFVAEEEQTYATAVSGSAPSGEPALRFASMLSSDRGLLITTSASDRPFYPPAPGLLVQVFPGLNGDELFAHHRRALGLLRGMRLCCRSVDARSFERDADTAARVRRSGYDAEPVGFIAATFWNWARGVRPQLGPLAEQTAGRVELERLAGER